MHRPRGRVIPTRTSFCGKAARAAIAQVPGAAEALLSDSSRAAWLCARFGITLEQLRRGVPAPGGVASSDPREGPPAPVDWSAELRAREQAILAVGGRSGGTGGLGGDV